jgi:crossover junction endodeoxyribonuclease RuvC
MGIDPGLAIMGYGIIDTDGRKCTLVKGGVVLTTPDMRMPERLHAIFSGTRDLLTLYKPDEIAFEELFFSKNITTGIQVAGARGVALAACQSYTDNLFEYTPMQIKQALTGYGNAEKKQMQQMVRMRLGIAEIPRPDDAADAVACAVTHAQAGRMREQFRIK